MKICLITLCRNEKTLVPYFLNHYGDWVDEIIVFDNESTDGTPEELKQHPKVKIISYSTNKFFKEEMLTSIRNDAFRLMGLSADWFIIVDFDEFVYHPDMRKYLEGCESKGITIPKTIGFDMYHQDCPLFDGKTPLREIVKKGVRNISHDKLSIVHRSVTKMNYNYGSHIANPEGVVTYSPSIDITILHFRARTIGLPYINRGDYPGGKALGRIFPGNDPECQRFHRHDELLKYAMPVDSHSFLTLAKQILQDPQNASSDQLHQLSVAYRRGHYLKASNENAFKWSLLAAHKGNPVSQYHVGMSYKLGEGIKANNEEAIKWFILGAKQNNPDCAYQVGMMLKPDAEGLSYLQQAAQYGSTEAQLEIAFAYHAASFGLEKDLDQYAYWLEVAANNKCRISAFNLAHIYLKQGNRAIAYKWAKESADKCYFKGHQLIEESYKGSNPFPDNSPEAIQWYEDRLLWLQQASDTPNFPYFDPQLPVPRPQHPLTD